MRAYVSSQSEGIFQKFGRGKLQGIYTNFWIYKRIHFQTHVASSSRQKEMDRFGVIRASSPSDGFTIQIYALGEREMCPNYIFYFTE